MNKPSPTEVVVPHEYVNDDSAKVIEWSVAEGERVAMGQKLCSVEFSKALVDIVSPADGWIFKLSPPGSEIPVGRSLAIVSSENSISAEPHSTISPQPPSPRQQDGEQKFTSKARALIDQHGLDYQLFAGISLVRESHVQEVLKINSNTNSPTSQPATISTRPPTNFEILPQSPIQQRTAKVIAKSAQEIPHSYLSRWIAADRLEQLCKHIADRHEMMVSVSEYLMYHVAQTVRQFKRVNAGWVNGGPVAYPSVNLGFAMNLESGDLIVPVIKEAQNLSLEELIAKVKGIQKKVIRGKIEPHDMSDGTATFTSLIGSGIQGVLPIIVPGQSIIVSIGDACSAFATRSYCLSIAFDHRIMNGAEAANVLNHLSKSALNEL